MNNAQIQRVILAQVQSAERALLLLNLLLEYLFGIIFIVGFFELQREERVEVVAEVELEALAGEHAVLLALDALLVLREETLLPQLLVEVDRVHQLLIREGIYHIRRDVRLRAQVLLSIIHV